MKVFQILAAVGLLTTATMAATSAEARPYHHNSHHGWHGNRHGWHGHRRWHGRTHCRIVWRHLHRVRVCR